MRFAGVANIGLWSMLAAIILRAGLLERGALIPLIIGHGIVDTVSQSIYYFR